MRINPAIAYIALYVAMYAAFGVASPFWPKFFETNGLTSQQIGLILSASTLIRLASGPLVGRLADLSGWLRSVLALCIVIAGAAAATFSWADGFWLFFLIALVQAAALAPTTSIADALTVSAARPVIAGKPLEYGWIRGSASAAFVLGTLAIGQLVTGTDLQPIIWMNVALLTLAAGATALLPVAGRTGPRASASPDRIESRGLLRLPQFRILLVVSVLIYGSHAMQDAFAVIRWSDAGLAPSVISLLWSEAVAAEVVMFFLVGPALLDRLGRRGSAGRGGRSRPLVGGRHDQFPLDVGNCTAAAWPDIRPASPRLHANHGDCRPDPSVGDGANALCSGLGFGECRADGLVGNALCRLWRRRVLPDGSALRHRPSVRLVRVGGGSEPVES